MHTERPRARRYPLVLAFRCDKNAGVPSMIRHLGAAIHRAEVGIILPLSKCHWEQDTSVVMPVASADQCASRNVARFWCEMLRIRTLAYR